MSLVVTAKVVTRAEIAGRPFYTASEVPQISKKRLGPGQHRHLPFVADGLPRADLGVVMCIAALLWDPLSIDEIETEFTKLEFELIKILNATKACSNCDNERVSKVFFRK